MPRYVTQRHFASCGPTVVINAGKWANAGLTMQDHYGLAISSCRCDAYAEGSAVPDIDRTLRAALVGDAQVRRPRVAFAWDIEEHLDRGGAVVACVANPKQNFYHIFLITGQTEKSFIVHNYVNSPTSLVRKNTISKYLIPWEVWFLTKIENKHGKRRSRKRRSFST